MRRLRRGFLLDTNVVSQLYKGPRADQNALRWLAHNDEQRFYVSVLTIGELRKGVEGAQPAMRSRLSAFVDSVTSRFYDRIVPVDLRISEYWGAIAARRDAAGTPIETVDALLGATASVYQLSLVTRNVRHFKDLGVDIVDPFSKA